MKKLAQRIVDPELDIGEKRKLMNEFKHYEHGGANDFSEVNYNELIDKFLDPNLPDHEYKPTMKALLEGDLDQERKNQVVNIINCHDKEQKANMVKRFKSSFEKDKEEKAKEKKENEPKINLLEFSDDGMTLVMRMLDKKIPREKKKRKKEEEQRKIEEENARKEEKMRRKEELLGRKRKDERMKKRDLMLKMRAGERKREEQYGMVGPSSVQEREEQRKKDRDRMKEDMKRFKEQALKDMKKVEREDMRREGWMVLPCNGNFNVDVQVVVPDLNSNLTENERASYDKALVKLREKLAERRPSQDASVEIRKSQDSTKEPGKVDKTSVEVATESVDPEFEKYFEIFSNPSLTDKEEMNHIKKLITENKSALVKSLVLKLDSVPGAGKSVIFKALAKKFVKKNTGPQTAPPDVSKKPTEESKKPTEESKKPTEESKKQIKVFLKPAEDPIKSSEVDKSTSLDRRKSTEKIA